MHYGVAARASGNGTRADRPSSRAFLPDSGVAVALLVAFGALVIAVVGPRLTLSFGPAHDGYNAATWGAGSRALREDGVIASRLGTRRADGSTYARHPPAIVLETAASEEVFGEHRWATRLPAFVASLAAIALVGLLLLSLGISPAATAVGIVAAFGSAMFGGYASMVDTPVVGLPFGVAVVTVWRLRAARRHVPDALVAAVAAGAVLTSWLGVLTVIAVAATAAARRPERPTARAVGLGGGLGLLILAAWLLWAYGSLESLMEALRERTGGGAIEVTMLDALKVIVDDWRSLFPFWVVPLGMFGLVLSRRSYDTAVTSALLLGVVGAWTLAFREGAAIHDYWTYWIVVPLALGCALAVDEALAHASRRGPLVVPALALVALGLSAVGLTVDQRPGRDHKAAAAVGAMVEHATFPPTQRVAWYVPFGSEGVPWLSYLERRPASAITTLAEADAVARAHPVDLVFVAVDAQFRIVPARDIPAMARRGDLGLASLRD